MLTYETLIDPPYETLDPLRRGLDVYNRRHIGDYTYAKLAVLAHDTDGLLSGGAEGDVYWDWLYIQARVYAELAALAAAPLGGLWPPGWMGEDLAHPPLRIADLLSKP